MNTILLTLLEATVTLYATRADGSLGGALWSGAVAENLICRERWLKVETRPSGRAYPKGHPLVAQYEIEIGRVWSLPLNQLAGFKADGQTYILDVLWVEEDTQAWQRRTFYGVTITGSSLASRDIDTGFIDGQEFQAEYFVPDSGWTGVAAAPVQTVPLVVMWNGDDGRRPLYTYANGVFTAVDATSDRAMINSDGSQILFAGMTGPVAETTAAGWTVAGLHDDFPVTWPRLDFYYGGTLLAAVTAEGVWARALADGELPASPAFQLNYQGTPVAALTPGLATALAWNVTN